MANRPAFESWPADMQRLAHLLLDYVDEVGSSPVVGGSTARVVYQPGGPSNEGPIYNDFNALKSAVNALDVPTIIDFDPEFATTEVPASGAPHVFTKPVALWSRLNIGQFLQFEDGASIVNVSEVRGFVVNILGLTGGPVIDATGQAGLNFVDCYLQGTRPAVVMNAGRIRLINTDANPGDTMFTVNTLMFLSLLGSSDVPANSVNGAGNLTFEINADSSGDETQANTGTQTWTYQDPTQQPMLTLTAPGTVNGRRAYEFNSATPISQALPDPATTNGTLFLKNVGAGVVTFTGSTALSTLLPGRSALLRSNGSEWRSFAGAGAEATGHHSDEVFWKRNDTVNDPFTFLEKSRLTSQIAVRVDVTPTQAAGAATLDFINVASGNSVLAGGPINLLALAPGVTLFDLDPSEVDFDAGEELNRRFISGDPSFGAGSIVSTFAYAGA